MQLVRRLVWVFLLWPLWVRSAPVDFDLPAQPAGEALLRFSRQAGVEILFPFDEVNRATSTEVRGKLEPEQALLALLAGTGFAARRTAPGKFLVTRALPVTGSVRGRLLDPSGQPARGTRVVVIETQQSAKTDRRGEFYFPKVLPGNYELRVLAPGAQPMRITGVGVQPEMETRLAAETLRPLDELTRLEPYVVTGQALSRERERLPEPPRTVVSNLDLPRSENDALPFQIYTRAQISRSGLVNLNEFLQREVLDSDGSTQPPEQSGASNPYDTSSQNLRLRGFGTDETVVLVNGRRLPETLTFDSGVLPPDVNLIPLSLVQEVQVLPASASALYAGNPVGGVVNIVLRPNVETTEVTTTYTNAFGYDAAQSSVALQHGEFLLDGKLRVRLNAAFTRLVPPTEAELGYFQAKPYAPALAEAIYRATPNVRSEDGGSLFGPGGAAVTSVAPGADGTGGRAAFAGREGVRNLAFFDSPGGFAASTNSLDYAYGRRQQRQMYYLSTLYDPWAWLQLGVDLSYAHTTVNRGYDVLSGDLTLAEGSPFNPFSSAAIVSLNEIAPQLGENYNEARLDYSSLVAGAIVRLPGSWKLSLDGQRSYSVVKFRGLGGVDAGRWQDLVDRGLYNPLRDTQKFGPPDEFYDEALIYREGRGLFATLGKYETIDAAARVMNQDLALPTGRAALNVGTDYRRTSFASSVDSRVYADGSPASEPVEYRGRTLERLSVFGELQAPLLPRAWLPGWIKTVESDLAVRYVAADTSRETNFAPTYGAKIEFAGGVILRGSLTTANRLPTPQMSLRVFNSSGGGGGGLNLVPVIDPRRGGESYPVEANEAPDPALLPEETVTQTAGIVFQRGKTHRFRASLDFVDTQKTNEVAILSEANILTAESLFPERVLREAAAPGDPFGVGRVKSIVTGAVNVATRHSQSWNGAIDYAWSHCLGGTLAVTGRTVYFQKYATEAFATSPTVDQLEAPDGLAPALLRYRANLGVSWSRESYGFGIDGRYLHARRLPLLEQAVQGSQNISPFAQGDVYAHADVSRWIPWKARSTALRLQARVNNVFDGGYPAYRYVAAGVQPYGDWRGRTYSLSLTATF